MSATGYQIASGADLNTIFQTYVSGSQAAATGYQLSTGADLNTVFAPYVSGAQAAPTGYKISTGLDLSTIFSIPGWTWNALGSGFNRTVRAIAVLDASNIFVGGEFNGSGATSINRIARWNSNTNTWAALGSGTLGQVNAIAILDASNIFVGGSFSGAGGITNTNYIAKWNNNTNTWSALKFGTTGNVNAIAVLDSSNIFVGGQWFSGVGNTSQYDSIPGTNNIAKWNNNTSTWSALNLGSPQQVNAIAVLDSSNIFIGGGFNSGIYNTSTSNYIANASCIAKWNNNAVNGPGAWSALNLGTPYQVNAIAILDSSNIFVGGQFFGVYNTSTSNYVANTSCIAKWNNNAVNGPGAWSALNLGTPIQVNAIAVLNSSNILVGGQFSSGVYNTFTYNYIAGTGYIAKWDNTVTNGPGAWSSLNFSTNSAIIYAITKIDANNAIVGGTFSSAGGKGITMISRVAYL
jgi:hypothetical protein